jgi:sarcosine oxidase subunit beta
MTVKTADVIIVGGGVHGASTAYELAKAGVKVVLFEKEYLGSGAQAVRRLVCASTLGTETNLHMAKYNLQVFPTLEEELDTGMPLEFTQWGYMWVAYADSVLAQLQKNVDLQEALTFPL